MTWRLRSLTLGIVGLWCLVALRLIYVQLWQHDEFATRADNQQRYVETIPARPGDILDRNGRLLATTVSVRSLFVDPSRMTAPAMVATRIAPILGLDANELARHLEDHREREFLWIKRRLSEHEEQSLLALELSRHACGLREEFRRRYPHQHLAAHVLGWRNIDGVGQAGVERSLDPQLQGTDGRRTLVRDARGYVLDILEEVTQPPVPGQAIALTIDLKLQAIAERQIDRLMDEWHARSASIVVLDPQSGDVLTMCSRPTFDPNAPAETPASSWINRAVSESYEPGSTLKPIIAAWALHTGAIVRDEPFDCGNGQYKMGTRLLHDTHPHGPLDISGILVKSSNIGMAQVGERLGNDRLFAALQAFGFGRRTGVELPDESRGIVRPLADWDHYSTGSIPMGQEIAATPLQMARAHAALASGGRLITPHLISRRGSSSEVPANVVVTQIVDAATAEWLTREPLVQVVTSGTARRAQLDGIRVFAKTGTAQVYDANIRAYANDRYVSSCLCGAPAEMPRALVLVTVNEAQSDGEPYGGTVAAPTAAVILKAALELTTSPRPLAQHRVDALLR